MRTHIDKFFAISATAEKCNKNYISTKKLVGIDIQELSLSKTEETIQKTKQAICFLKRIHKSYIQGESILGSIALTLISVLVLCIYSYKAENSWIVLIPVLLTFGGVCWILHTVYMYIVLQKSSFYKKPIEKEIQYLTRLEERLQEYLAVQECEFIEKAEDVVEYIEDLYNLRPDIDQRLLSEIAMLGRKRIEQVAKKHPINLFNL